MIWTVCLIFIAISLIILAYEVGYIAGYLKDCDKCIYKNDKNDDWGG